MVKVKALVIYTLRVLNLQKKAIQAINGKTLEGKVVHVYEFQTKKQRGASNVPKFTNVFIKNLNLKVTEKDLREKFNQFGNITSLVIMQSKKVNKSFGFINYKTPEEAQKAVENLNDVEFMGEKLYVSKAQKKTERLNELRKQFEQRKLKYQDSNLYIKNLDDKIDDKKLYELFSQYGNIISSKVMKDENNLSKGFGFVCFSTSEEAQKAFAENGRIHFTKPLYVALAQRKEIRTAQLQAQYAHRQMTKGSVPFNQNQFGFQRNPQNNYYPNNNNRRYPKNQNQFNNNNFKKSRPTQRNIPQQTNQDPKLNQMIQDLRNAPEGKKKNVIGDFLYTKIEEYFRTSQHSFTDAGKITGMLLDSLDEQELLNLAEDNNELINKIEEAVTVLQEHQENPENQN